MEKKNYNKNAILSFKIIIILLILILFLKILTYTNNCQQTTNNLKKK